MSTKQILFEDTPDSELHITPRKTGMFSITIAFYLFCASKIIVIAMIIIRQKIIILHSKCNGSFIQY